MSDWKTWAKSMEKIVDYYSIPRYCFGNEEINKSTGKQVKYQLHSFCDASNYAFSCVVYLRRIVEDRSDVGFLMGKSKVVLKNQVNWIISRKELEAAKLCADLMRDISDSLKYLGCSLYFWTDFQVVLKWIVNPALRLVRFVKRRVDKIYRVGFVDNWNYVCSSFNPADVGTRNDSLKEFVSQPIWIKDPSFLYEGGEEVRCPVPVTARKLLLNLEPSASTDIILQNLIETAPNLYTLSKRAAYLVAFKQFNLAKARKAAFCRPKLDAKYLDDALLDVVKYVQSNYFGAAVDCLKNNSPDKFDSFLKCMSKKAVDVDDLRRISELKTLRPLRPCIDAGSILRVEGRLENAELPLDAKHPIILPSPHALTRLIALHEHFKAAQAGHSYTLMKTRQRFWIIHRISSVKYFLPSCSVYRHYKATPVRQLMADLPECRVTATNKPFKFCGVDYLGPFTFFQNRRDCKAWRLLFTCLCTRCIHVELVTCLDLNNFLLAFSRFVNLREAVDTMYFNNGSTFHAAASVLPSLLSSTEFHNSLRKRNISWVNISP